MHPFLDRFALSSFVESTRHFVYVDAGEGVWNSI